MRWVGWATSADVHWERVRCEAVVSSSQAIYDYCKWPSHLAPQCPHHGIMYMAIERATTRRTWACVSFDDPHDVPLPMIQCQSVDIEPPVVNLSDDASEANEEVAQNTLDVSETATHVDTSSLADEDMEDNYENPEDLEALRRIACAEELESFARIAMS